MSDKKEDTQVNTTSIISTNVESPNATNAKPTRNSSPEPQSANFKEGKEAFKILSESKDKKEMFRKNSVNSDNSLYDEMKDKVSELYSTQHFLDQKALSRTFHFTGSPHNQANQGGGRRTHHQEIHQKLNIPDQTKVEGSHSRMLADGATIYQSMQRPQSYHEKPMSADDRKRLDMEQQFVKNQLKLIKYIEKGDDEKFI